jgi:putative MATE family efflux protein
MMMLSGGSIGGTITGAVAQRLGAGDRAGAEVLAFHAVLLALLLAALSALVFLLGGSRIYGTLGGTGAVLEQALAYSDVLFMGCVTMWLANALAAIVRATGNMMVAAKCLVTGSVVQVIAAGVMVLGLGPVASMGIGGAAAGIVLGYGVAAALLLVFLLGRCGELRLRLSGIPVSLAPMVAILKVGALSSVNSFCSLGSVIVITAVMARLGVDVLAGYGVGSRLDFLIIPMVFGFGSAATAMVGVHFGANEIRRAHQAGWTAAAYSAALSGLVGGTVALFPGLWVNLFTDSESVRAICGTYLHIVGPFYAFFGLGLCLYFASQGTGRMLWLVVASMARLGVIAAGSIFLSHLASPTPEQFFWTIAAGMLAQALVSGAAIQLGAWTAGRAAA